jgi:hypothetical protein
VIPSSRLDESVINVIVGHWEWEYADVAAESPYYSSDLPPSNAIPGPEKSSRHSLEDPCQNLHYSQVTQPMTGYSQFIPEIGKYIDLILLSQLARFKINLFRTTSTELLGSCDGVVEIAIKSLASQVAAIDGEAEALRLSSWNKGHDTQTLDHQLAQCRKMRPGIELASLAAKEADLQEHGEKKIPSSGSLRPGAGIDANQQDRINLWLLKNLEESSEEKTRRRSFLAAGEDLGEEQWARLVLKYWWLDDAAVVPDDESMSINGAVDSAGKCHPVRVMLQSHAVSDSRKTVEITETELKGSHCGLIRWSEMQNIPRSLINSLARDRKEATLRSEPRTLSRSGEGLVGVVARCRLRRHLSTACYGLRVNDGIHRQSSSNRQDFEVW